MLIEQGLFEVGGGEFGRAPSGLPLSLLFIFAFHSCGAAQASAGQAVNKKGGGGNL